MHVDKDIDSLDSQDSSIDMEDGHTFTGENIFVGEYKDMFN